APSAVTVPVLESIVTNWACPPTNASPTSAPALATRALIAEQNRQTETAAAVTCRPRITHLPLRSTHRDPLRRDHYRVLLRGTQQKSAPERSNRAGVRPRGDRSRARM